MTDYLYHYCSVETLELILKNKTFRFSSLGVVDDMEEPMTSDYDDIGKICFVSCWTDLVQESVDMWRTYTGGKNGVRIGLPKNLFTVGLNDQENNKIFASIYQNNDVAISPPYIPEPIPITYTRDDYLINLSVLNIEDEKLEENGKSTKSANFSLDTKYLGRFKRFYWSGQSEWRYRFIAVPGSFYRNNQSGKYLNGEPKEMVDQMKLDLINLADKDYIDFPFKEVVLEKMEVLLSPLNKEKDNEAVKRIVNEYTSLSPSNIKESEMKIRK